MERFIELINSQNNMNNSNVNIELLELLIQNIGDNIQIIRNNNVDRREHPKVSDDFLNSLSEIENDKKDLSCSICLEEFKIGEKCIKLPCEGNPHYFHKGDDNCPGIMEWFTRNNTCPICRTEFPSEERPIIQEVRFDLNIENTPNNDTENTDEGADGQSGEGADGQPGEQPGEDAGEQPGEDAGEQPGEIMNISGDNLLNFINRIYFARFINNEEYLRREEERQLNQVLQNSLEDQ